MSKCFLSPDELQHILQAAPVPNKEPGVTFDFPFLRTLASAVEETGNRLTHRQCEPGEIIFNENEMGETIAIIQTGKVAVVKGDFAAPTILGLRGAGEILGEMALLEKIPRSASAVALEPTQLICTDRTGFQKLLNSPNLGGLNLLELLSSRLRSADEDRSTNKRAEKRLVPQVTDLESEKQNLLVLQRVRQETTDLIVHDLRNPLGAILFTLKTMEIVLPEQVVRDNRELLDIGLSSCTRLQRLVDSLLEVSQMDAGEAELLLTETDLKDLIQKTMNNVLGLHRQNIQFETKIPQDIPKVEIDSDKIERVLANLLDNALKHTPTGGKITVACEADENMVTVSINDTGSGISPEDRERIFDRFSQVSGEKRKRRGFGLGLTYCKLAVEAHEGQIRVEPGYDGIGSRFIFTLPLKLRETP